MKTATQQAIESARNDLRFRSIVQHALSYTRSEYGPIEPRDPRDAERVAIELAELTAATTLQMIYNEDAELSHLKAERDHYKKLALSMARVSPVKALTAFDLPNDPPHLPQPLSR